MKKSRDCSLGLFCVKVEESVGNWTVLSQDPSIG